MTMHNTAKTQWSTYCSLMKSDTVFDYYTAISHSETLYTNRFTLISAESVLQAIYEFYSQLSNPFTDKRILNQRPCKKALELISLIMQKILKEGGN